MEAPQRTFLVIAEISLIVEALQRAAKRQEVEAKWHYAKCNEKLKAEHNKKARAMRKIIVKLQGLKGVES